MKVDQSAKLTPMGIIGIVLLMLVLMIDWDNAFAPSEEHQFSSATSSIGR